MVIVTVIVDAAFGERFREGDLPLRGREEVNALRATSWA
jgi:hypothetical protein